MPELSPTVPACYNTADRAELDSVELDLLEGALPAGIWGHYFVVGPVGTVDSNGLPWPEGTATTVLCGDGMVARFDFVGPEAEGQFPGSVTLKTALMKTPDYWADWATNSIPGLGCFGFGNHGIMRFSPWLGMRNFLNTAFVPIGFDQKDVTPRLLVTIDAGQPWEIDPTTLELSSSVGSLDMWYPDGGSFYPFPLIFATAHPVWDPRTKEGFFVNWGKGMGDFIDSVPLAYDAQVMCEQIQYSCTKFWNALNMSGVNAARAYLKTTIGKAKNWIRMKTPECLQGVWPQQFTYLLKWTGGSEVMRWNLVDERGASVNILGSVHQMAVTEDYVILLDSAFDIGLNSLMTNPFPSCQDLERMLRYLTARPILNESIFYIVKRADLEANPGAVGGTGQSDVNVKCRRVRVPMGACHFQADYANKESQITLHVSHNTATDVSEWVAEYDISLYGKQSPDQGIAGVFPAPMDVSRLARYVFNGETGACLATQISSVNPEYWSVALYAGDSQFTPQPQVNAVGTLYWNTTGFFPDQATKFINDLYRHYPNRVTPESVIRDMNGEGRPSYLFRTDMPGLGAVDSYQFDEGIICGSPQFIILNPVQPLARPSDDNANDNDGGRKKHNRYGGSPIKNPDPVHLPGFIATMVYTPDGTQLWIFDAHDLAGGPLCKYGSDQMVLPFTAHSCWLNQLGHAAPASHSVKEQLEPKLKGRSKKFKQIFNDVVFPNTN